MPPEVFYKKNSSQFCNIHQKTPVLTSLLNKVADHKNCNFIEKRLQPRRFCVNIGKLLREEDLGTAATEVLRK